MDVKGFPRAGPHVPLDELFPPDFMAAYTDADTIQQFLAASGMAKVAAGEVSDETGASDEFNAYVHSHTQFDDWQEMKIRAEERWTTDRMCL
ncbi:MAG: hypothetical protein PHZ19_08305 [Candidatus Thermoplasmatota archaeon]|nr:hypothetical protein [Candidatus Thermoplasmatota archaeon]